MFAITNDGNETPCCGQGEMCIEARGTNDPRYNSPLASDSPFAFKCRAQYNSCPCYPGQQDPFALMQTLSASNCPPLPPATFQPPSPPFPPGYSPPCTSEGGDVFAITNDGQPTYCCQGEMCIEARGDDVRAHHV